MDVSTTTQFIKWLRQIYESAGENHNRLVFLIEKPETIMWINLLLDRMGQSPLSLLLNRKGIDIINPLDVCRGLSFVTYEDAFNLKVGGGYNIFQMCEIRLQMPKDHVLNAPKGDSALAHAEYTARKHVNLINWGKHLVQDVKPLEND